MIENRVSKGVPKMPHLKSLKEMCIYIKYSMSIIEKVFHYEENEITVIK